MTQWTATAVVVSSLAMALWCLVGVLRTRPVAPAQFVGLAVVELLVLAHVGYGVAHLVHGDRPASMVTFVGYLIAFVLVLPLGAVLAWLEPTRWGSVVALCACLVDPILILRINQVWSASG